MAAIRFSGMASGLPPNIVEQIMDAERIPIRQIEVKKADEDNKLKLVNELGDKISAIDKSLVELVGTRGFAFNKLLSGDPSIVDGTVDPQNAMLGEWQVEVMQLAQKPGALSNGFPDKDRTEVGIGYIRFQTNEGMKRVYIDGNNSTLEGVAKSINKANIGIRAQVMNDRKDKEAPYKLLVTGLATGDDKQVNFPMIYLLDGDQDFIFDQSRPAHNAKIKLDGFEFELPENRVKDVIPGVTLELKQANPGREVMVTVKEDQEAITGKVKTFIDSYNDVLSFIQNQNKLGKDKSGRDALGPLGGDSLIRNIEGRFRRIIQSPQFGVQSNISRVSELGIEFNRNGTLNFNQEKFASKLSQDPTSVAMFLRGDGFNVGFIPAIKREVGNLMNSAFGPISVRRQGLQKKIDSMNQRIDNKTRQLEKKEESLRQKFANLETKMAQLQQQGSAIGAGPAAQVKAG